MITKICLIYVGDEDPPNYCLENFVDETDLLALLEANCRRVENVHMYKGENV